MTSGPPSGRCSRLLAWRLVWVLACWVIVVAGQLAAADPGAAHAELVASSPRDGQHLSRPPQQVMLQFSEPVGLVTGGLQLLSTSSGAAVRTGVPVVHGSVVRWPMPKDLPDGAYLVRWRVVADDGHPVAGAFTFGVLAEAGAVLPGPREGTWSWPVTIARWLGYLAYAAVAGVLAFVWLCWPQGRAHRRTRLLLLTGLGTAVAVTALGFLLQGPYVAGVSPARLLDPALTSQVLHDGFGVAMLRRLLLYAALTALLWRPRSLQRAFVRWLAAAGVVAVAVTMSGTGHAAVSGRLLDRLVDSVHVLCAGIWVGGLLTLVVLASARSGRPEVDAFVRFSRMAMVSVLALLATGVVNATLRLHAVDQLWDSRYGLLLTAKASLVLAALAGAAVSRRRVNTAQTPWRSVRFEAAVTVAVLALSAVLTLTAPPSA